MQADRSSSAYIACIGSHLRKVPEVGAGGQDVGGKAKYARRTWEDYLEWEAREPTRYELVDGQIHAMDCGTAEHDTIGNNLGAALHAQMRGKP